MTTGDVGRHLGGRSDFGVEGRDSEATALDIDASTVPAAAPQHFDADPRVASHSRDQLIVELPDHDPYITVEVGRALLKLVLKISSATQE